MRRFTPLRPDPRAPLARANPVAKLAAAAILMAFLFVASGPIPPMAVLAAMGASLPLTGLRVRTLLGRTRPLLIAALMVGVFNVALAPNLDGRLDLAGGLSLGLRLLAIALAGVLAVVTTDPTDLADSLQQQAHLSPRLAVAAMAGIRMLPILAVEWQLLGMARRARGVDAGWSPLATVRLAFGKLLALLVGSVRRATRPALAMDARGFGTATCHTVARPQRMRVADWGLLLAAAAVGAAALGIGSAL
jgi:energy-coupling factor transport system permease protein